LELGGGDGGGGDEGGEEGGEEGEGGEELHGESGGMGIGFIFLEVVGACGRMVVWLS
jgi:hypothetical protein